MDGFLFLDFIFDGLMDFYMWIDFEYMILGFRINLGFWTCQFALLTIVFLESYDHLLARVYGLVFRFFRTLNPKP